MIPSNETVASTGRRGAHGDFRHRKTVRQQGVTHRNHGTALVFRNPGGSGRGLRSVNVSRVGKESAETEKFVIMDHTGQHRDSPIARKQAAAMQSHVDFQEQSNALLVSFRPFTRHLYALLGVDHHADLGV